ncbi:hypothetical protein Hypma_000436 [Hypsizygus marmoreus]|uniref:Uncharacterized protein n=1 Tax=Hypsizygus marmoreus TaxID=39966 RepID=A0A369JCX1_HYPMA|nr:hypothetical protein Hypma_000436 [Hypsizygus marmoreus]
MRGDHSAGGPPGETKQQQYRRRHVFIPRKLYYLITYTDNRNKEQCNERDRIRMQKKRAHEKEMIKIFKGLEERQLSRELAQMREITPEPKLTSSSPMETPEGHCVAAITLDSVDQLPDDFFSFYDDDGLFPPIQKRKPKKPQVPPKTNIDFGPFTNSPICLAISDSDNDNEAETDQYAIFKQLKADIDLWASAFGGQMKWLDLGDSFQRAREEDTYTEWTESVWSHAAEGRALLRRLQSMDRELPPAMYLIRELWRIQVELVEVVV